MKRTGKAQVRQAVKNALVARATGLMGPLSLGLATLQGAPVAAADLPVPCVAGGCATSFVTSGAATVGSAGDTMTINQTSQYATLNWRSFDIGRDNTVDFVQPSADAVALNRIHQNSASRIFGRLNANGRVYLLNQNGFLFGQGSQVNVSGLIASSLDINPTAFNADGSTNLAAAARSGQAAFRLFGGSGETGSIDIEQGASLRTTEGGQILLFAPEVSNRGSIATPGGQAVLAAGESVFLASSSDPNLRGILVEVGVGGTVTNGDATPGTTPADPAALVGQITAERGNVTLVGAAVNQLGRISATTSVSSGGSIFLKARSGGSAVPQGNLPPALAASQGGELRLGTGSVAQIALDGSGEKTVDSTVQPVSRVELEGERIVLESGSRIVAPHGQVNAVARADGRLSPDAFAAGAQSDARIYIADGATIDVSGATAQKNVADNVIEVELRGDELADAELQRNGPLRGKTVQIDIRETGEREDGSTWVGSPIGDLSGWVGTIERTVQERSTTGGTVSLRSEGDVILRAGSRVDISGGQIGYSGGYVNTTRVFGADGVAYDISEADASRPYTGIATGGAITVRDQRWGVDRSYRTTHSMGRYESGYVEGRDAGALHLAGQQVVLDGTVDARTVAGRYQRVLPQAMASTAAIRPFDQLPFGGQLLLGKTGAQQTTIPDYQLGDLTFTAEPGPRLTGEFDPFTDVLGEKFGEFQLRTGLFGVNGFGRLQARANGTLRMDEGLRLDLRDGASFDLQGGAVDIGGTIATAGGSIRLAAVGTINEPEVAGLWLRGGAVLDVSGGWVNDLPETNGGVGGTAPLAISGGSVRLTAEDRPVSLEQGSLVDVSAGAWLDTGGALHTGNAGSITISGSRAALAEPVEVELAGTLRAHGFDTGGSVAITAGAICIADASTACTAQDDARLLWLRPSWFAEGGFGSYSLNSNAGGIQLAAGTVLALSQQNLQFDRNMQGIATGTALESFTRRERLRDELRAAVDLNLNVAPRQPSGEPFNLASYQTAGDLVIGRGARLLGDAGAQFNLASSTRLLVDGEVRAPGGEIGLTLSAGLPLTSNIGAQVYFPDQGIQLGNGATVSTAGTAVLTATDDLGRRTGTVLDGGRIRIDADRGHVMLSAGSVVDVSGTAAGLDMRAGAAGAWTRDTVGSAGGALEIEAAEAIVLGGELRGASGKPRTVAGGSLSVTLNAQDRDDPGRAVFRSALPIGDRVVELVQSAPPVYAGGNLPSFAHGRATVSADAVTAGGFDSLTLGATNYWTNEGTAAFNTLHLGRVSLGDVNLALARNISLHASVIESKDSPALLRAPRVSLGNPLLAQNQQARPALTTGPGSLDVQAQQIDLIGNSVLNGFRTVDLRASGDLRLTGVRPFQDQSGQYTGHLGTTADLTLTAAQIYPTTLTNFTVLAGQGKADGLLRITASGNAGAVLSAGGQLQLRAPVIRQEGVLRAPFGTIDLDAEHLHLGTGSVTSTSGAGLAVPFGQTRGGLDWVYLLDDLTASVYGEDRPLPTQRVNLSGDEVDFAAGAIVDVSGGGRLLASEFVAGPTGKLDVLASDNAANSFAILPTGQLGAAAYDPEIWADAGIEAGATIHLAGTGDIPAGEYIVLPARYALLPGGYLITPQTGYTDITAAEQYRQAEGGIVVAGRFGFQGSGLLADDRSSGFLVTSGSAIQNKARYTLTSADAYFADADLAGRLPADAGTLAIQAERSLDLQGTIRSIVQGDARGGALEIASTAIEVVAGAAGAAPAGVLRLRADDLNALGMESLLLGGFSTTEDNATHISVAADAVTVDSGARLHAAEVTLVASDEVRVADDATVSAAGREVIAGGIRLQGDGAYLRVATADAGQVTRSGASGAAGRVTVAEGALLDASSGSISLESSRDAELGGTLSAGGGELVLTGNAISLGGDADAGGWVLGAGQLAALDAQTLRLNSRTAIDLREDIALQLENLSLTAGDLHSHQGASLDVTAGGTVTLAGIDAAPASSASRGGGSLSIAAQDIRFTGGNLNISGTDDTTLVARGEVRATADARLSTEGDLDIATARMSVASGADFDIQSSGAATLRRAAGVAASGSRVRAHAVDESVPDLGAALNLAASSITVDTQLSLPSGTIDLRATDAAGDGVRLGAGAVLDAAGRTTAMSDSLAHSRGGNVRLEAAGGDVRLQAGSRVDVSAPGAAAAGSIAIHAASGQVELGGTLLGESQAASGGSISVDAQQLTGFADYGRILAAGGFDGDLAFRQRGSGNLRVAAGESLRGAHVSLTADVGGVEVAGTIRATATDGGRIQLAARSDVVVSGVLDAGAADASQRNGRISLSTTSGAIRSTAGAVVRTTAPQAAAGPDEDGSVFLRAPQSALLTLADASAQNDRVLLGGDWSDVSGVTAEGFKVHVDADGVLDQTDVDAATSSYYADAASFGEQAGAISARLAEQGIVDVKVLTGVEIQSGAADGGLQVDADWNLADWRFDNRPGVLTLRAAGNLNVNASINDGFASPFYDYLLMPDFGESWSYRLIGGADTSGADVLATRANAAAGDVVITARGPGSDPGSYTFVRTGSGSIDVAAARDIVLDGDGAMIYTAGQASDGLRYPMEDGGQLGDLYYPVNGGDIRLRAGGDVTGALTDQFVTDWLWRIGNTDDPFGGTRSTAWTVNFERFHQGVGALAGGDVSVVAGGDVADLYLSAPTIGRQRSNPTEDRSAASNSLEILGGGHVAVAAGGDITGGGFYSGRGLVSLTADGAIGASERTGLAPILALGDSSARAVARGDVKLESVLTPTLLLQSFWQEPFGSTSSYFSTYGANSALWMESIAGKLRIQPNVQVISERHGWSNFLTTTEVAATLLPGRVDLLAHRGDAEFGSELISLTLAPSPTGRLRARAFSDVGFWATVSDVDPQLIPDPARPLTFFVNDLLHPLYAPLRAWQPGNVNAVFNAATPVRLAAARDGSLEPSQVISATGDVRGSGYFGGPLAISAGRDVLDLNLRMQNLMPGDVSVINAGRHVAYAVRRGTSGVVLSDPRAIDIDGPGQLLVTAGGNVDLSASLGITSRGDLVNGALDPLGAGISIIAGLNGQAPRLAEFQARYLADTDAHLPALLGYLQELTGTRPASQSAALEAFDALSDAQRQVLLYRVLLSEVRASAIEAASLEKKDDYSRGFTAIETLFPGSTGENNPFLGDLNLFFSRIYTLDGGDIAMLAPGGGVNVGLAAPPSGFGITKQPSQLGLATRAGGSISLLTAGDVQVNESRMFAIRSDEGRSDILVWSSTGDIDAGRGAKTAISAPEPTISYDNDGRATLRFSAALAGSGIQTRAGGARNEPGDVVLAAPRGVVNAGDAGIVAGNLTVAATAVLGADNIKVSGVSVGVPVDTGGLGASLAGVSAAASSAADAATALGDSAGSTAASESPIAETALSWLEVFVTGVGADNCRPDDAACLERQGQ